MRRRFPPGGRDGLVSADTHMMRPHADRHVVNCFHLGYMPPSRQPLSTFVGWQARVVSRTDHYRDPQAPKANSIVVATTVFVRREDAVLLLRRSDNGLWALPGGAQEIGETIAATAVRETREETGIEIEVIGLVGVYSDPQHVVAFSDGEIRQQFSICFKGAYKGGEPTGSEEGEDVRWIERAELAALEVHPSMRLRIDHGYADRPQPYIG